MTDTYFEGCGQEGPIRCIFLREFHPTLHARFSSLLQEYFRNVDLKEKYYFHFQVPENYMSKDLFDTVSVYIIQKAQLQISTITVQQFVNVNGKEIWLITSKHERLETKSFVKFQIEATNPVQFGKSLFLMCLAAFIPLSGRAVSPLLSITLTFTLILFLFQFIMKVQNEHLLIVKSFGIQYTVTYYVGCSATQFIPWSAVHKVFINEVISLQRVLFILTIMTQDPSNKSQHTLITLFKHTRPRLKCLELMYRELEEIFDENRCRH